MSRSMNAVFGYAVALVLLMLSLAAPLLAGPLEDAIAADDKGDYATALPLLGQLADQGSAQAQYRLGSMYDAGRGVVQSDAEALKWYRMAAEQGNASAQYDLALMYDKGQGVAQNYTEAAKWYVKAANQGDAD